ncbi:hypothetical protein V1511DRAFT_502990 [Dipodascopsis uninucleata]
MSREYMLSELEIEFPTLDSALIAAICYDVDSIETARSQLEPLHAQAVVDRDEIRQVEREEVLLNESVEESEIDLEPKTFLKRAFPTFSDTQIETALSKANNDPAKVIDEMLNDAFLQSILDDDTKTDDIKTDIILYKDYGMMGRFYSPDSPKASDSNSNKGSKRQKRKKKKVLYLGELNESTSTNTTSPVSAPSVSSQQLSSTVSHKRGTLNASESGNETIRKQSSSKELFMEAERFRKLRNEALSRSAREYKSANGTNYRFQVVTYYGNLARDYHRQLTETLEAASDSLVREKSSSYCVDLHGLDVTNAVRVSHAKVDEWWQENRSNRWRTPLKLITGKGNHNPDGRSKIRQNIVRSLQTAGWVIEVDPGYVLVKEFGYP